MPSVIQARSCWANFMIILFSSVIQKCHFGGRGTLFNHCFAVAECRRNMKKIQNLEHIVINHIQTLSGTKLAL